MYKILIIFLLFSSLSYTQASYYYKNNKKQIITFIPNKKRNLNTIQYYKNTKGVKLGISNTILLKTTNKQWLIKYLKNHNLKLLKQLTSTLYIVQNYSNFDTLSVANSLHENSHILYAHPNFLKSTRMR